MYNSHFPPELVENIARGDAVLFVGAGLSRGAGLPSWPELVLPLADRINLPPERRANLLQVAQDYENRSGRQALEQYLSDQTDTTGTAPTGIHRRLLQLGINTWVTTNFDDLLERTLQDAGQPYRKVVRDQDLSYTSAGKVTVLKLHGDRQQPGTLIVTQDDYDTFFERFPLIESKLTALLLEKTFLFIGYRVGDPDFNQLRSRIGYKLEEHQRRAYAVLFGADQYTVADLRRRQIDVLSIPLAEGQDPARALGIWLDELILQVQARKEASHQPLTQATSTPPLEDLALFDVGHRQDRWGEDGISEHPRIGSDYAILRETLKGHKLQPKEHSGLLSQAELRNARLLVLVLPFKREYASEEADNIRTFVSRGGRLLALSYYGGDVHWHANLGKVVAPFGITLGNTWVHDKELPPFAKPPATVRPGPGGEFLEESDRATMPSCCTVEPDPQRNPTARAILWSADDSLTIAYVSLPEEAGGVDTRTTLPEPRGAQPTAVVAEYKLSGGRVAVLGSWRVFSDNTLQEKGFANTRLMERLLQWLLEADHGPEG